MREDIECYRCGDTGHFSDDCPAADGDLAKTETAHTTVASAAEGNNDDDDEDDGDYSFFANLNIGTEEDDSEDRSELALAHADERYQGLNPDWILLDNQSTSNFFCDFGG